MHPRTLKVTSNAFRDGDDIPSTFTCDGEDVSPSLLIDHHPLGTQTLAIIVEDTDAPGGIYNHWIVWNIPPQRMIEENRIPGISGRNGAGKTGYHGPCPLNETHRYFFYVFALDARLSIEMGAGKRTLQEAMNPHILAQGVLVGKYTRKEPLKIV